MATFVGHMLHARAVEGGRWSYAFCPCACTNEDSAVCILTKPQDAKAATRVVTCAYRAFLDTPFVSYKVSLSAGGDDEVSDDEAPELDIDAEDAPPPTVVSIYDVRSRPKVTFSDAKKVLGGVVCVEPGVVVTSELMNMIDGVYKYMHSQKGTPFVAERAKGSASTQRMCGTRSCAWSKRIPASASARKRTRSRHVCSVPWTRTRSTETETRG